MKSIFRKIFCITANIRYAAFSAALLVCAMLTLPVSQAYAQAYPNKPIKLVLGFAAGAGSDIIARIISQRVGEQIGTKIVVDNKPGANGTIASEAVVMAPPDGYTVYYNTSSVIFNALLDPKEGDATNALKSFEPVTRATNVPLVLIVRPNLPVTDVKSLIAYTTANAGKLNYASGGIGNITHLVAAYFLQHTGLDATHVPYRSANDAIADVAAGRVDFYFYTLSGALPYIKNNRVKALAVTGLKRASSVPDVPTLSETVIPGFSAGSWTGLMVPAKTPAEIINKLNEEFNTAMRNANVRAKLAAMDVEVAGTTPEEYATFLRKENDLWRKVIRDANIKSQ